jgi:hypothetical protein
MEKMEDLLLVQDAGINFVDYVLDLGQQLPKDLGFE